MDHNVLGTIITVPKNFKHWAYIDYQEGMSLRDFPQLARALDTFTLPSLNGTPVGSLQFGISQQTFDTWVDWEQIIQLSDYPQLEKYFHRYVQNLPAGVTRDLWEKALAANQLPQVTDMFFRVGEAGSFNEGSNGSLYHYPVIEFDHTTLVPLGTTTVSDAKDVYSSVEGLNVHSTDIPANLVLLAQNPQQYKLKEPAKLIRSGSEEVGFPSHMGIRLWVNTETYYSGVPRTHKLVIKVECT